MTQLLLYMKEENKFLSVNCKKQIIILPFILFSYYHVNKLEFSRRLGAFTPYVISFNPFKPFMTVAV